MILDVSTTLCVLLSSFPPTSPTSTLALHSPSSGQCCSVILAWALYVIGMITIPMSQMRTSGSSHSGEELQGQIQSWCNWDLHLHQVTPYLLPSIVRELIHSRCFNIRLW
jgi:hypothetical protein